MLVLGIDTSTRTGGLGLYDDGRGLIGEYNLSLEQTHSERLIPMMEALLQASGRKINEVDGFAVTLGPGSFTGVRIGVTTAKTLAQVTDKPLAGVSTLEVTAYNLVGAAGRVCPIFDARNRRVYTTRFQAAGQGLIRLTEDHSCSIDELVQEWKEWISSAERAVAGCGADAVPDAEPSVYSGGGASVWEEIPSGAGRRVYFVGDAVSLYQDLLREELGEWAVIPPQSMWMPRGGLVAELGLRALLAGERADLFALTPNYLKPAEAEVTWQKKYGGR